MKLIQNADSPNQRLKTNRASRLLLMIERRLS